MKVLYTVVVIAALFIFPENNYCQVAWKTFDHKNGFSIRLPSYFSEGLLVAAGSLQYFDNSKDSSIELSVETFGNGSVEELNESYQSDLQHYSGITYKINKVTWYVVSGQNEDGVFYNKSIIRNGVQHHLRITYPVNDKPFFDSIVSQISSSFK